VAGRSVDLTTEKIEIRRLEKANLTVVNEGTLTVALDTEVTDELSKEGDVRDLVRGVQNLRKESGLAVTDRLKLQLFGSERLKAAWEGFSEYVSSETLAVETSWGKTEGMTELEAGDEAWLVSLARA